MKVIALLVATVGFASCTSGNGPFYISAFPAFNADCILEEDIFRSRFTTLDVAAEPEVLVGVRLSGFSEFSDSQSQPPIIIGTRRLTAPQRDRALVQRVVLRYSSRPSIPGISASLVDTIPLTIPMTPVGDEYRFAIPFLGPNARQRLRDLPASNSDAYVFTTMIELQGITEPSGVEWRTTPVPFSAERLVKSEVTCNNPADNRLKSLGSAFCVYRGDGVRLTTNDCCNLATPNDVSTDRGCDFPL